MAKSGEVAERSVVDEWTPAVYLQHPAGGDVSEELPLRSSELTLTRAPVDSASVIFVGRARWNCTNRALVAPAPTLQRQRVKGLLCPAYDLPLRSTVDGAAMQPVASTRTQMVRTLGLRR